MKTKPKKVVSAEDGMYVTLDFPRDRYLEEVKKQLEYFKVQPALWKSLKSIVVNFGPNRQWTLMKRSDNRRPDLNSVQFSRTKPKL